MVDGLKWWIDKGMNLCVVELVVFLKCLEENNYDKVRCVNYFLVYKECKRVWNKRKVERRRCGLLFGDFV